MKHNNTFLNAILFLICFISTVSNANEPTMIPWPVGTTAVMMDSTKTLMNSYGDPQNNWYSGLFHGGIDIDSHTESPICSDVRCVIDNAVISYWFESELPDPSDPHEWVVVTTPGTGEFVHEDFGWTYEHLNDPRPDPPYGWHLWDPISRGDTISSMNPHVQTIHTHFAWTDWDFSNWCYVNPLDYLTPAPTGTNFTWTFNPSGYAPAFEYFFLENTVPFGWPNDPADVQAITLDQNNLSGDVDVFFGFGLSGVGQTTTPECGRNDLAAERIEWNIQRSTVSGLQLLVNKYLVNFNCPLNNEENEKVWQLYFKWDMDDLRDMFTYIPSGLDHEGLVVCLSNCGNAQGWENLGIDNIEENCWQTNSNHLFSGETVNPVLAAFPDGPYKLGVKCYAHDENVTFPDTSEYLCCELHNFHPALQEVSIIDLETDTPYYHGLWEPSGL
ncbi:MAG: hypothetical protein B1H09_01785, partial [Gemmatimonadaceae bacterium 4484_173]